MEFAAVVVEKAMHDAGAENSMASAALAGDRHTRHMSVFRLNEIITGRCKVVGAFTRCEGGEDAKDGLV